MNCCFLPRPIFILLFFGALLQHFCNAFFQALMCWRGNSTNSFGHLMTYTTQYCGLLHDTCAKKECILKVDGKVISTNTVRKCEAKAFCQMFDFNVGIFECKTYCCSNENFCNGVEAVVMMPHFTVIVFFALTIAIFLERILL